MDKKDTAKYQLENGRHEDETFEEYKERRRRIGAYLKRRLRGMYYYRHDKKDAQGRRIPFYKENYDVE